MTLWLVIFIRVVANPAANVFQKLLTRDGAAPIAVIFVAHALLTMVCMPILWAVSSQVDVVPRSFDFWSNITICAVLAVACNTLLVYALRLGDLSLLGPINAYKSVVSLLPSLILLSEFPEPAALGGIALIVVGSVLLVGNVDHADRVVNDEPLRPRICARLQARFALLFHSPGVRFRIAALLLSATEAAFLKRAVLASTPTVAFAWWSILGAAAAGATLVLLRPFDVEPAPRRAITKVVAVRYVYLTIATGLMQYCTIVALYDFEVGPLLALFQVSTLLSVFFGYRYFAEPHFVRRLFGSAVMIVGAVAIVVCRQRP